MTTIVTRAGKGSPLTNAEVDANFSNLNTDKYQAGASPDFVDTLTDKLSIDTTAVVTAGVGELAWDEGNGTAVLGLKGGNVSLQLGQETVVRVFNDAGSALVDGEIVYISGAQGNRIAVKRALADSDANSLGTIGMVTEPIAAGAEGFVTHVGVVNGLNTIGLTPGAPVYLSPTTPGAYTTTKPSAPSHMVTIGWVERVHAVVGSIFVKIDNGYELEELHNVLITSPTGSYTQELAYDATAGVWKNYTKSTSTVAEGTNLYFTDARARAAISGTAPISYSASTGVISMAAASSTVDGYLRSTDWNTFNGKYSTGDALGTPSSGTLTNCTGYTYANLSGTVPTWNQNTTGSSASCTGNSATATSSTKLSSTNWVVEEVGGVLYFKYGGVNKGKLDSSGNFTVTGNITAYGTV